MPGSRLVQPVNGGSSASAAAGNSRQASTAARQTERASIRTFRRGPCPDLACIGALSRDLRCWTHVRVPRLEGVIDWRLAETIARTVASTVPAPSGSHAALADEVEAFA